MLLVLPYQVDVPTTRSPVGNFWLVGFIAVVSLLAFRWQGLREILMLTDTLSIGVFGHLFVHADFLHLAGNLLFLWVFGNAVCARLGDGPYVVLFLLFGVAAALIHLLLDGNPAIGASGAINGVVGLFAVLYPQNIARCAWLVWIRFGTFEVAAIRLVVAWLVLDVLGATVGGDDVGHLAHLGGLAAGVTFGVFALRRGLLTVAPYERSLLDLFRR